MADENLKLPPEIEQLTQKLVADPKSRVFAQLADAYRKAGMIDEAIETAKKGMEHHPAYATAHLILGRCYLEKQMYALAREEFEATIKSDPQNMVGYKLLAGTYEKQNMFAEAVKFYQMVLDLEPGDAELSEKVALLKSKKDEKPQAVPEPEPEPAPQPAPVVEIVRGETEPEPVKEEQAMAAEEKPVDLKPEEPAKEAIISPEPIPFPDVLAEAIPKTEPVKPEEQEAKPVLESPEPENKSEEENPATKEESIVAPESSSLETKEEPAVTEAKEESVKAEEPEAKAEEKPAAADDAGKPAEATVTLAEIYVQQGFYEKAVEVYRELISADPGNDDYKARMDELLEKAYPEEKPEETAEEKKEPEPPVKQEPAAHSIPATEPESKKEPVLETPASSLPEAPPAVDIFGGMFDKFEKPEQKAEEVKAEEPKAVQPDDILAGTSAPEEQSKPVSEPMTERAEVPATPEPQPVPEPAKEAAVDFSALFSDAPKTSGEQPAAAEPPKPETEGEKKAEGENTVSSFQSWLSSLQK
ncbi:tetratricopeptide repeat protein [candidate division TA06 bacterium]|nr:tetratricopeptide repeat protein [candidate division TA06 bacterium]